jgi:hypothetical protein
MTCGESGLRLSEIWKTGCPRLLVVGSGQFGTPCERMQREKATSLECAAPPALDEPPEPVDEPVDDGPLPHAAASRDQNGSENDGGRQAESAQGRRCGNASHRRTSFLPQEHSAGLILAVANLGEHLR